MIEHPFTVCLKLALTVISFLSKTPLAGKHSADRKSDGTVQLCIYCRQTEPVLKLMALLQKLTQK